MSASGRWAADIAEAVARASAVAGNPDPIARMTAFRELCAELGDLANQYACPQKALNALVNAAAYAYTFERERVRNA